MSPTAKALGIDRLSRDEQIALVHEIWDLIAASGESVLTDVQRAELDRRVAEDDADPDGGIPWEQVRANTLRRLGQ
jgi:putative addiction module component (TIGR02574 family)